jgi:hypothetical protein
MQRLAIEVVYDVEVRKRRPQTKAPDMKSADHTVSG